MNVPIERSSFASTTADEAWEALSRMYTRARPHTSSPDAALAVESVETTGLAVDRVALHAAQGAFSESPDQVNVISVLSGRISVDFGRHGAVANVPDDSYLYLPDSPADLSWDTFTALAVRVPMNQVARAATETTGLSADALRFTSMRPASPALGRLWLRTAMYLWESLNVLDGTAGALVHQELLDVVTSRALMVFPSTAMTLGYLPGPGDTRPTVIRRAVAFIDAHASLPITAPDIAQAAGTEAAALKAGFRRHLDTTPAAYLHRVRLDGAHRDLQTGDPSRGDTVAAIAARWGFIDLDRFAVDYRQAYGCSPSRPLHG